MQKGPQLHPSSSPPTYSPAELPQNSSVLCDAYWIFLLTAPLHPRVQRGILKQRPLLKNAGNAARNRMLMLRNDRRELLLGYWWETRQGESWRGKGWICSVFMAPRSNYYREKLAERPSSSWVSMVLALARRKQCPVCCSGFYRESPFLLAQGRCAPEIIECFGVEGPLKLV